MTLTPQSDSESWRDDLQLAQRVLARDVQALDRFALRMKCVPMILAHCNSKYRGLLSQEDLADLGQDVLAAVWRRLPTYLGQGALESWVHPFCTQMFLNRARAQRRRPLHTDLDPATELHAPDPAPYDLLDTAELIHRHLVRLEGLQAAVIRARHFEALTFEQIAQRLDVSLTAVKNNYRRGLDVLRTYIAPHLGPDLP